MLSLTPSPSVPASASLRFLPVLTLSSPHLSLCLLCISLRCSSSSLHQIESDSCHQAYFRRWHTHTLSLALPVLHFLSLFVSCSGNFLHPPANVPARKRVSKLDRFLKPGPEEEKVWRKTKAIAPPPLPFLYLSIWSPTPGRGFLTVCFSPERQPL